MKRVLLALVLLAVSCEEKPTYRSRDEVIPPDARKGTPETDPFPPVLRDTAWEGPIPMPGPVTTAGAEDSPFITPDGQEFYFFFTGDVRVPVEQQVLDGVTGIWSCRLEGGQWTEPERVVLSNDYAMDGAEFVFGDTMWFASVREGSYGEIDWYTAVRRNGEWANWRNAGRQINGRLKPGELHISSDHRTMYYGKTGQYGGLDLCRSERTDTGWGEAVNLGPLVNGGKEESRPFLSSDGTELWFTCWSDSFIGPCVCRSLKDSVGEWQAPAMVVGSYAGEPTLDDAGNLYFVHHYYTGGDTSRMLEADIYVCRRRSK